MLKNNQIKIADFGSAIDLSISAANANVYAGTIEYFSPETLNYSSELKKLNLEKENITFKTDIW